jgi:DNA-binding transcriptional MerR regulator
MIMGIRSYRTKEALQHLKGFGPGGSDITMNQLLHWVERKIFAPSVKEAEGHPSYREYALIDLVKAGMIARFLSMGITLKEVAELIIKLESVSSLSNENLCSLWEMLRLKSEREKFRYFFEIKYHHDKSSIVESRSGFCGGLHEILGLITRRDRPLHLSHVRMVDMLEVLEALEKRTGDII